MSERRPKLNYDNFLSPGITVVNPNGSDIKTALRLFKKQFRESEIIKEVFKRKEFKKKSTKRREIKNLAKYKNKFKIQEYN